MIGCMIFLLLGASLWV